MRLCFTSVVDSAVVQLKNGVAQETLTTSARCVKDHFLMKVVLIQKLLCYCIYGRYLRPEFLLWRPKEAEDILETILEMGAMGSSDGPKLIV